MRSADTVAGWLNPRGTVVRQLFSERSTTLISGSWYTGSRTYRPAHAVPDTAPVVQTAAFTIDIPHHRVIRDGDDVRVTPTEWHLLEQLARNVGKVVGRRELLTELRGPHLDRQTHYLRVYVAQLRRKLEPDPAHPRHLLTEPGIGYRLVP